MSGDDMVVGLEFRDYSEGDHGSVTKLWRSAGLPFKPDGRDSSEELTRQCAFAGTRIILAFRGDVLAGTVVCTHDGRKGWLNRLAVLPGLRERGVGAALVERGEGWLREQGIRIVAALVEEWNETSLEVFSRLGYTRHEDIIYFTKRESKDV